MDLQSFLAYLLTAGGTGAGVFAVIELSDRLFALPTQVKRVASLVLAVVIPAAALGIEALMGWATVDANSVFSVVTVIWLTLTWLASQGMHAFTNKPQ